MTARTLGTAALRSIAIAVALTVVVVATPVLGVLGVAVWQEYAPASLSAVIDEVTALTEANDFGGVVDNFVAVLGHAAREPG